MSYIPVQLGLSKGQKTKLIDAVKAQEPITLRLSAKALKGTTLLHLTTRQIKKIQKAQAEGTGCDLKLSLTQLNHNVKSGAGLFGDLVRTVANPVIDHGIDFAAGAAKKGLKGVVNGVTGGKIKAKKGKGFFGDIVRSVANPVIDHGIDFGADALKKGLKGVVSGVTGGKIKKKYRVARGKGVLPPGY